jgi:rubrerythrin
MADREKLIEVLGEFLLWPSKMKNVWMPQGIEKLADHLLANGVVVREKGKWTEHQYTSYDHVREENVLWFTYACSKCGKEVMKDFDFCPNCGADMRKGENG